MHFPSPDFQVSHQGNVLPLPEGRSAKLGGHQETQGSHPTGSLQMLMENLPRHRSFYKSGVNYILGEICHTSSLS